VLVALRGQELLESLGALLIDGRGGHVRRIAQSGQNLIGSDLPEHGAVNRTPRITVIKPTLAPVLVIKVGGDRYLPYELSGGP
jgi:hypothetical protein